MELKTLFVLNLETHGYETKCLHERIILMKHFVYYKKMSFKGNNYVSKLSSGHFGDKFQVVTAVTIC